MFALKNLFATLYSILFALSAISTSALANDDPHSAAKAASGKKEEVDERDYYTRRAQELLEADSSAANTKPHPLTNNYPDQYVVVCTGGCKNRQAYIVDFEPHRKTQTKEIGEMIPTAAGSAAKAGANIIECIAGCREDNSIYFGTSDAEADWDSVSSAAQSSTGAESGRWLSNQN